MRTGSTPAKSRTILCIWAVPRMARGVRRRPLRSGKRGRRRIVLTGPSLPPPIPLSGSSVRRRCAARPLWTSSPPPDSSPVAEAGYLTTAPTRKTSNRQSGCYVGIRIRHPNQRISAGEPSSIQAVLPSTKLTVSALRTLRISALNVPARMHHCRRFGPDLTVDAARLAEKRGRLLLSFHGTLTRYPSTSSPGAPIIAT